MATFKEINLQVGARLQMTLQHGAKQSIYYTELIGYVDGEYLIIKTPFENGLSVQMQVDEQVTLRILAGVDVFTLTCRVKTIFRAPHYYMHLSFPTDIKSIALRGAVRAKVNLPVQVNGVAGAGVISDISVTGAAIIADSALGELNEETLISFEFPYKTDQSECAYRYQRDDSQRSSSCPARKKMRRQGSRMGFRFMSLILPVR